MPRSLAASMWPACKAESWSLAFISDCCGAERFCELCVFPWSIGRLPKLKGPILKGATVSATAQTLRPPSRALMLLEGRAIHELGAFLGALPLLSLAPKGDGHPVLVLPGLVASDTSTRPLRSFLKSRGYAVSGWRQGHNLGLHDGVQHAMVDLVHELSDPHGRKIRLVGWSLGGGYARQLAKMMPDRVRSVITLGSPFAGHPKATNAWRVYEMASGRRADEEDTRFGGSLSDTPPVPTTAIFSRTDGICAWQGCMEKPSARSENIEVESSHCGMGHHPAVVYAVADRLAQLEGKWTPFHPSACPTPVYPDPHREGREVDLLPRPALRGERVGVRGSLGRFGLAESPPHPNRTGRCFASPRRSDLSPQAGRGDRTCVCRRPSVVAHPKNALCVGHGASTCPHHRTAQARTLAHRLHRHHRVRRCDRAARWLGLARHAAGVL